MRCTPIFDSQIKLCILSWSWEAAFGVIDMQLYALINFLACGIQVTVDMNIETKQWQFFFYNLLV